MMSITMHNESRYSSQIRLNHEAAWYTCTANHICSLQRICRLRAHVKNALSADDRTKAQIESAKPRFRIHSIQYHI